MNCLFAVHLSDFLLTPPWLIGGWTVTGLLLARACLRIQEDEVPRVALLTAVFFISSSVHLKLGLTSAHLLLNGLVGAMLGWRMPLAIVIGLILQTVLLGHGGRLVLGLNAAIITLPGLIVPQLFRFVLRSPLSGSRAVAYGWLTGSMTVLATITLHGTVLILGGKEDLSLLAGAGFLAHLPLAVIEGVMLGAICRYVAVVRPELLGVRPPKKTPAEPSAGNDQNQVT